MGSTIVEGNRPIITIHQGTLNGQRYPSPPYTEYLLAGYEAWLAGFKTTMAGLAARLAGSEARLVGYEARPDVSKAYWAGWLRSFKGQTVKNLPYCTGRRLLGLLA